MSTLFDRVINFKSNFYGELKVCQRINRLQVFQGLTLSVYQQKAHHAIKNVLTAYQLISQNEFNICYTFMGADVEEKPQENGIGTAERDDQDDTDSDDSCDSFPHDGSFKMMALSPKSSSVKVLEGTNVDDLLESLQDSTGTIRKEVDISHTYENNNTGFSLGLEKWQGIFQSGKFEQTGKVGENHTKYWKSSEISDKCYLLFLVIFK